MNTALVLSSMVSRDLYEAEVARRVDAEQRAAGAWRAADAAWSMVIRSNATAMLREVSPGALREALARRLLRVMDEAPAQAIARLLSDEDVIRTLASMLEVSCREDL